MNNRPIIFHNAQFIHMALRFIALKKLLVSNGNVVGIYCTLGQEIYAGIPSIKVLR